VLLVVRAAQQQLHKRQHRKMELLLQISACSADEVVRLCVLDYSVFLLCVSSLLPTSCHNAVFSAKRAVKVLDFGSFLLSAIPYPLLLCVSLIALAL
jgi:hypothetical protein